MDYSERRTKATALSTETALQKIKNWCAYQERSQQETRRKLFEYALPSPQIEQIIATLIEENFLNEERFAIMFASGKFRIKQWGRIKIRLELQKHRISEYCINKALKNIQQEDYEVVLQKVIDKKRSGIKGEDRKKKYHTVLNYALSRGFESDLIIEHLKETQI